MEIWDLYNKELEIIGEHVRGTEMPENGYHLVVHIWISLQVLQMQHGLWRN